MTTIHPTDILLITTRSRGSQNAMTVSGISSLTDLFRHVRSSLATDSSALVTLQIRNRTQGWAQQHTIRLKSSAPSSRKPSPAPYPSLF